MQRDGDDFDSIIDEIHGFLPALSATGELLSGLAQQV
jgi:hypothetical protein